MDSTAQQKILCAGECMMELRNQGDLFAPGFAGDVANFAIYLKRFVPGSSIYFLSAVGTDILSAKMRDFFEQECFDTVLLFASPDKTVGLYLVDTDERGVRSISY